MNKGKYIIFIGGIPGVGKTSISGYLAKELNVDIVLSGDYLREFLRPLFPREHIIQSSVYDAWNYLGGDTKQNIEEGFREQASILNKGFNSMFKRALQNGESLILESLYFLPSLIEETYRDKIVMLYLYVKEEETNASKLKERTKFTHSDSPGERLVQQLPRYREIMKISIRECENYHVPEFDTTDYTDSRKRILEYVQSK